MSATPKRFNLDEDTRALPIMEEARETPVIVEIHGKQYQVNLLDVSSPFTLESVYGSLPPMKGRKNISDDELEEIIDAAREEHAQKIIAEMIEE